MDIKGAPGTPPGRQILSFFRSWRPLKENFGSCTAGLSSCLCVLFNFGKLNKKPNLSQISVVNCIFRIASFSLKVTL